MAELFSIRAASGAPSSGFVPILLRPGEFLAPVTLEAVRARVYYDGATLFGASVEPTDPVRVNQAALPGVWTPIPCPAHIELRDRLLVYEVEVARHPSAVGRNQHWDTQTVVAAAVATQPAATKVEIPFDGQTSIWQAPEPATLVFSHSPVEPPTRLMTPERFASLRDEPPVVLRVDPVPPSSKVHSNVSPVSARGETTAKRRVRSPIPGWMARRPLHRVWAYLQRELQNTPKALRWTLFALPAVAWLALEPSAPLAKGPDVLSSAKSRALASAAPQPRPHAPDPSSAPAAEAADQRLATIPSGGPTATARPRKLQGRKRLTLESKAADAAARGAYAEAVALYQELADLHPDRPEFTSAARILRAR